MRVLFAVATVSVSLSAAALASQAGLGGMAQFVGDSISKVTGNQSFQAKVVVTMTSGQAKDDAVFSAEYMTAFSDGKYSVALDTSKLPVGAGERRMANSGKSIFICRSDKKVVYLILAAANTYCEVPILDPVGSREDSPKVERKVEGNEKVGQYDCEKVRATFQTIDGSKVEVLVWVAQELKGVPVKIERVMPAGEKSRMVIMLEDIKISKPAASVFDPPETAKRYTSIAEFLESGIKK